MDGICRCWPGVRGALCDECVEPGYRLELQSGLCVPDNTSDSSKCVTGLAQCLGDPHCVTLDGSTFDFHGQCEYTLLHTFCADRPEVTIQVRQQAWPNSSAAGLASVVSHVAVQEVSRDATASVVEIAGVAGQGRLSILVDGGAVDAETLQTVALGGASTLVIGRSGATAMVRLSSGIVLTVHLAAAENAVSGALAVQVRADDPLSVCGCTEGLLGFADGSRAREFLLPALSYRNASNAPVQALAQFAAIPSLQIPSFAAFGEMWRLQSVTHNASRRLFQGAVPEACSAMPDSSAAASPPLPLFSPACSRSPAALACCSHAPPSMLAACLTDFCKLGNCTFVYPPVIGA